MTLPRKRTRTKGNTKSSVPKRKVSGRNTTVSKRIGAAKAKGTKSNTLSRGI